MESESPVDKVFRLEPIFENIVRHFDGHERKALRLVSSGWRLRLDTKYKGWVLTERIFSYLDLATLLKGRLVSKHWREVIDESKSKFMKEKFMNRIEALKLKHFEFLRPEPREEDWYGWPWIPEANHLPCLNFVSRVHREGNINDLIYLISFLRCQRIRRFSCAVTLHSTGNLGKFKLVLKYGTNNEKEFENPLIIQELFNWAVNDDKMDALKYLLQYFDKKLRIFDLAKNDHWYTCHSLTIPFLNAVKSGNLEAVKLLLPLAKQNPNIFDDDYMIQDPWNDGEYLEDWEYPILYPKPLAAAIKQQNFEMIGLLINNTNLGKYSGRSFIEEACKTGNIKIFKYVFSFMTREVQVKYLKNLISPLNQEFKCLIKVYRLPESFKTEILDFARSYLRFV